MGTRNQQVGSTRHLFPCSCDWFDFIFNFSNFHVFLIKNKKATRALSFYSENSKRNTICFFYLMNRNPSVSGRPVLSSLQSHHPSKPIGWCGIFLWTLNRCIVIMQFFLQKYLPYKAIYTLLNLLFTSKYVFIVSYFSEFYNYIFFLHWMVWNPVNRSEDARGARGAVGPVGVGPAAGGGGRKEKGQGGIAFPQLWKWRQLLDPGAVRDPRLTPEEKAKSGRKRRWEIGRGTRPWDPPDSAWPWTAGPSLRIKKKNDRDHKRGKGKIRSNNVTLLSSLN